MLFCAFVLAPSRGVSDLRVDFITSKSVTFSWVPPMRVDWNGIITSYVINYTTVDQFIRPSLIDSYSLMPANFTNNPNPQVGNSKLLFYNKSIFLSF